VERQGTSDLSMPICSAARPAASLGDDDDASVRYPSSPGLMIHSPCDDSSSSSDSSSSRSRRSRAKHDLRKTLRARRAVVVAGAEFLGRLEYRPAAFASSSSSSSS